MATRLSSRSPYLRRFVSDVRSEYWSRGPFDQFLGGARQPNTVRLVAGQVLEDLPAPHRVALVGELLCLEELELIRDLDRIFRFADSVGAVVFDLACEVCWQILVSDVEIRIEDEIRAALTAA
jgi:hypothetical protein